MVFLKYLVEKVQQKAPPSYNGLVMMLWAADTFMSCIQHAGPFLEQDEAATVSPKGSKCCYGQYVAQFVPEDTFVPSLTWVFCYTVKNANQIS